ncbi:MAG: YcxB family protein [Candidatus Limnocylindria bacterium]
MTVENAAANSPIRIEFEVTDDDVVDASRAYAGYRSSWAIVVGIGLAVTGVVLWVITDDLYFLALTVVGAIAVAAGPLRVLDRAYVRGQPQARIGTLTQMELDDRGLTFRQGGVEGFIQWSAVTELRDGERALLLLQGRSVLAYLPKRAFTTEAQLDAAVTMLARRIARSADGRAS